MRGLGFLDSALAGAGGSRSTEILIYKRGEVCQLKFSLRETLGLYGSRCTVSFIAFRLLKISPSEFLLSVFTDPLCE